MKPVYWCSHDHTALAEAEVEYEMHTSPSVYVRYKLTSDPENIDPRLAGKEVYTIIWTTTPWTLPASVAVAFNPEIEYVALEDGNVVYIVAKELIEQVREACDLLGNLKTAVEIASFPGSKLDRVTFAHPFLDRQILGVNADYVTTEQGTGAVHTAPAHGPDDFVTGQRYDLPLTCNVDAHGKLRNGLPEYDGLFVHKANAPNHRAGGDKSRADGPAQPGAQVSALLALPQSADLPCDRAVVHRYGDARTLAQGRGHDVP